jgi:hypothetical protein
MAANSSSVKEKKCRKVFSHFDFVLGDGDDDDFVLGDDERVWTREGQQSNPIFSAE